MQQQAQAQEVDVAQQLNIRDLAQTLPTFQEGKVYRTSCLLVSDNRTDVAKNAVQDLGIRVLLDLRSEDEMKEDCQSQFATLVFSRDAPPLLPDELPDDAPTRYIVALLERSNLYRGVLERVSPADKAAMLWYSLVSYRKEQEIFMREINRGGLLGLNELTLDQCGPELAYALKVVTTSAERGEAMAFQCKLGKDRTGLMAALILLVCGADDHAVVNDYVLSNGIDEIALGPLTARQEKAKKRVPDDPLRLQRSRFVGASEGTMRGTLLHLRKRHGGIEAYLDAIGFDLEWRVRLLSAVQRA